MKTKINPQTKDQTAKGAAIGIFVYFASKYNLDPELVALLVPVLTGVFAWVSTKTGDKEIASFFNK